MFPSVFRVGQPSDPRLGHAMAAALRFRGNGMITGLAAADLWGILDRTLRPVASDPVDVLLVGHGAHSVPSIRVHRVKSIARCDFRWRYGIPVASPARALLDVADELDELELESALFSALDGGWVRPSQVVDVISRNPHVAGVAVLRSLADQPEALQDTRSRYERRMLELLDQAQLPMPVTNASVAGHMVDMYWPALKLVIEFDGWEFHRGRSSFETDRLRDQNLVAGGHRVMRVTARQIDQRPLALVTRVATAMTMIGLSR